MVPLVNSHSNATSRRWHLWEIDLRFAPGLPPERRGGEGGGENPSKCSRIHGTSAHTKSNSESLSVSVHLC